MTRTIWINICRFHQKIFPVKRAIKYCKKNYRWRNHFGWVVSQYTKLNIAARCFSKKLRTCDSYLYVCTKTYYSESINLIVMAAVLKPMLIKCLLNTNIRVELFLVKRILSLLHEIKCSAAESESAAIKLERKIQPCFNPTLFQVFRNLWQGSREISER